MARIATALPLIDFLCVVYITVYRVSMCPPHVMSAPRSSPRLRWWRLAPPRSVSVLAEALPPPSQAVELVPPGGRSAVPAHSSVQCWLPRSGTWTLEWLPYQISYYPSSQTNYLKGQSKLLKNLSTVCFSHVMVQKVQLQHLYENMH